MMKNNLFLLLLLFALLLTGCGKYVSLKGKIVFSDDKTPVPTGTIFLESKNHLARGTIKPDGTFTTGSIKSNDGLPPGTYRVYFENVSLFHGYTESGSDILEHLIDGKYASASSSGLTLNVDRSTRYAEFELDRYKK